MNAVCRHLLTAVLFLHVAAARSPEYDKVAVVPLPLPPPTELGKVIAALEPYGNLNSRLVRAQIAVWLQKISANDLQKLQASIPNLWSAAPFVFQAHDLRLREAISEALSTHPDLPISSENPLTAIEAGHTDGSRDYLAALNASEQIPDPAIRTQYLLGVAQSAGRADTYSEAQKVRDAVIPLLSGDEQHDLTAYQFDEWTFLWPAQSIADWVRTKPEDERFGPIRHVLDHGAEFFATLEEAAAYLPNFGRSAKGQAPIVAEAMGKVLAARSPETFMKWWLALPCDQRMGPIDDAIAPLLRQNPTLIDEIIPHIPTDSLVSHSDVTREWFRYDPVAALRWCSRIQDQSKHFDWWIRSAPVPKPIDPAIAVDLLNRFPDAKDTLSPSRNFNRRHQQPETFARELLGLTNPKKRQFELCCFGMKLGYWDGPAALAWAKEIDQDADRKLWVNGVIYRWMEKSPEEALRAAEARPELTHEELTRLKGNLPGILKRISEQKANQEPSHYAQLSETKTVTFAVGGETGTAAIVKLRHSLADLTRPGEPAISNAAISAEVLSLGQATVMALLEQFEVSAPVDAKENALRILLLERWAL
ncbi:MAG: hypothetical protein ABI680_16760, partial [Chthoniobacteraceae bacterium]